MNHFLHIRHTPIDLEERTLLARLIEGDMRGFEALFHRYYPLFYAFINGMVKDAAYAEDIAQNIFMKVWINREKLDVNGSIKTYLFVLAKHEIINHFKAKRLVFGDLQNTAYCPIQNEAPNSTEQEVDFQQISSLVEELMRGMPPQRQLCFRLSRFENLTNRQIAERLGLSVRTVDKHIELALKELRPILKGK